MGVWWVDGFWVASIVGGFGVYQKLKKLATKEDMAPRSSSLISL